MAEETTDGPMGAGEDFYGSAADMPKHEGDESGEMEHSDSEEAILPKSILAGKEFKVGDELTLRVTAIHDDRISVAYATGDESDKMASDESDQSPGEKATVPEDENYS